MVQSKPRKPTVIITKTSKLFVGSLGQGAVTGVWGGASVAWLHHGMEFCIWFMGLTSPCDSIQSQARFHPHFGAKLQAWGGKLVWSCYGMELCVWSVDPMSPLGPRSQRLALLE